MSPQAPQGVLDFTKRYQRELVVNTRLPTLKTVSKIGHAGYYRIGVEEVGVGRYGTVNGLFLVTENEIHRGSERPLLISRNSGGAVRR